MPPAKPSTSRRALQPACDACHVRRVKCSHDQPCAHCNRLGLNCTYTKASSAKKTAGKRIEALRQADRDHALNQMNAPKRVESWTSAAPSSPGSAPWVAPTSSRESGSTTTYPVHPYIVHGVPEERLYHQQHPPSSSASAASLHTHHGISPGNAPMRGWPSSPRDRQSSYESNPYQQGYPPVVAAPVNSTQQYSSVGHQASSSSELGPVSLSGPPFSRTHGDVPSNRYSSPQEQFFLHSREQGHGGPRIQGVPNTGSTMALDGSELPAMDYLQSSFLPPFSTSMADSLFNQEGSFNADTIFNESAMPPLVPNFDGQHTVLDMLGSFPSGGTPGSSSASGSVLEHSRSMNEVRPDVSDGTGVPPSSNIEGSGSRHDDEEQHALSDSVLIPTLALFYERLGGVMPIFSRTWLFSRLDREDHHNSPHFAAMLLAMSALTVMQAQSSNASKEAKERRSSGRSRRAKAVRLLGEALKLRESPFMGSDATLEQCCTSFFVFATLFGLGDHTAGWYRLRESITIAHICRLHEPSSYEGLPKDEAERRLRMYWLLAITERAFAIQSRMPIILTGNPRASTASLRARLGFQELSDFPDLQLKLFDEVDEKFVDCWNQKCQGTACRNFDKDRAIALWTAFTDGINTAGTTQGSVSDQQSDDSVSEQSKPTMPVTPNQRRQIQRADVEVTRHWLLNRLWLISMNHGLLSLDAIDPPLRVDHAVHVAQSALDVCNDQLTLSAMEAHGVGFTYKLYDIAQTLVLLCKDEFIVDAISREGHLEKQATAAHTKGQVDHKDLDAHSQSSRLSSNSSPLASTISKEGHSPMNLRHTVRNILNDYVVLFKKFREGDHPYLNKLTSLVDEMHL